MSHHFGAELKSIRIDVTFSRKDVGSTSADIARELVERFDFALKETNDEELESIYEEISVTILGGVAAVYIYEDQKGIIDIKGAQQDFKSIQNLWGNSRFQLKPTFQEIIESFFKQTEEILRHKWTAVEALAEVLIKENFIDGEKAKRIIEKNL